jgi:diacylglycerol kinase family enzyme
MIIFLNPSCDYGKGRKKWQKVEPELRRRFGEFTVEEILSPDRLAGQVEDAIAVGENFFIAAGGDGSYGRCRSRFQQRFPQTVSTGNLCGGDPGEIKPG